MGRRYAIVTVIVAAALGIAAVDGLAEIIRLPDGRFLQGEILESSKTGFTFKRWDSGGVVKFSWEQIHKEDQDRLRRNLGLDFSDQAQRVTIDGVRLHLKSGDVLEGVLLEEEDPAYRRIKRSTGEFKYPRDVIKREETIELDVLSVFTQEEAYERKWGEKEMADPDDHWDVASWCRQIGYFEMEKEHLLAVQEGAPDHKPDFIRNRLEALDGLVEEAQVRRRIKEIMREVARKNFSEAAEAWEALREEFPENPIVTEDSESVVEQIDQAKVRFTRAVVVKDWYNNMRRILRKKSLDKELKLADAKKWVQKDLTREILGFVSERRNLEESDIKTAFEERKVFNVHKGNYGTGTFIVEKSSRYGGGSSGVIDDLGKRLGLDKATRDKVKGMFDSTKGKSSSKKKQLSPDDWWEASTADMKYQWMLAFYAENSGDMEVVRSEYKPCTNCRGKGFTSFLAAGGGSSGKETGTQHQMCKRCQGLGKDKVIVFK
ncbi:MAG: hypothetical protein ACYTFG_12175 [Planctomycetota bacterium]|jgi:hypothetical protein